MSFLGRLFSFGAFRQAVWKRWYPFLTRRLRNEQVLFLNYAFETDPPMGIPLSPADEPDRACIQLYHHVATQADLAGKRVLEVSCGHGGGASYLARTLHPAHYTGLDLNPEAIRFCQERHRCEGLDFLAGDAGHLPFPEETFDAVLNVEASHCYPDFPLFLSEVVRVLRPGGHFLYADFRFPEDQPDWDLHLAASSLKLLGSRVINPEVLRGMNLNSGRSLDLVMRHLPGFLHGLGRDFAGTRGSKIHRALEENRLSYRSYCFVKP